MQSKFRSSFLKDVKRITQMRIAEKIELAIIDVEEAKGIQEISNIKKLKGSKSAYRIRVGDYRIGILVNENEVEFISCLHRKEVYKFFP
jgi:mRNA interferase RelE/StbE